MRYKIGKSVSLNTFAQPAAGLLLHAAMRRCATAYSPRDDGEYRVQPGAEAFDVALHAAPRKHAQALIAVELGSADAYGHIQAHYSESSLDLIVGFQTAGERRICARRVAEMFESVLYFEVVQPADFAVFLAHLEEAVTAAPTDWRPRARALHLAGDRELDGIVRRMAAELDAGAALVGESLDLDALRALQRLYRELFALQNYRGTGPGASAALQVQQMNLHYSQRLARLGGSMERIAANQDELAALQRRLAALIAGRK